MSDRSPLPVLLAFLSASHSRGQRKFRRLDDVLDSGGGQHVNEPLNLRERRLPAGIFSSLIGVSIACSSPLSAFPVKAQDSFDSTVTGGTSDKTAKPASGAAAKNPEEKAGAAPDPVSLAEHVNRGNTLMRARRYMEAMAEYKAARALDPKNPIVKRNIAECYNNMGVSLYRQKNFPNAIIQFEKCLQVYPPHSQARQNINLCRQMMDREGIPDMPSEDPYEDPEEKQKKAEEESKKADAGPKVGASSASSSVSVSSGGSKLYVSGSQIFPVYSEQANAVNERVLPTNPVVKLPGGASSPRVQGSNNPQASASASSDGLPNAVGTAPASSSWGTPVPALTQPLGGPLSSSGAGVGPAGSSSADAAAPTVPAPAATPVQAAAGKGAGPEQNSATQNAPVGSQLAASYSAAQGEGLSLEDKLSAIEMKLYGKKNSEMALMKRLEQLEIENFGQVRQGTNFERVEYLRKAISNN